MQTLGRRVEPSDVFMSLPVDGRINGVRAHTVLSRQHLDGTVALDPVNFLRVTPDLAAALMDPIISVSHGLSDLAYCIRIELCPRHLMPP